MLAKKKVFTVMLTLNAYKTYVYVNTYIVSYLDKVIIDWLPIKVGLDTEPLDWSTFSKYVLRLIFKCLQKVRVGNFGITTYQLYISVLQHYAGTSSDGGATC